MRDWITFLITGPEANLEAFAGSAPVELFDRRNQTIRCRAHRFSEDQNDEGELAYERALEAAKKADVTMQDLVDTGRRVNEKKVPGIIGATATVSECVEEYPIKHLGSHGMKWGKT